MISEFGFSISDLFMTILTMNSNREEFLASPQKNIAFCTDTSILRKTKQSWKCILDARLN